VPALIIGLTVVAHGTSAPELAVTLQAALNGFLT
jgi:Ca2+/Na+ antiporter